MVKTTRLESEEDLVQIVESDAIVLIVENRVPRTALYQGVVDESHQFLAFDKERIFHLKAQIESLTFADGVAKLNPVKTSVLYVRLSTKYKTFKQKLEAAGLTIQNG